MTPKSPHANCDECPLKDAQMVPTKKPTISPVRGAIVSRSPGKAEVYAGEPMASKRGSGEIIDFLLNQNGIKRGQVLLTNAVLCVAPDGAVPREAIKACAPRLAHELAGIETVLACGREAVGLLIGAGSIDRYRGYRHSQNGRHVVATNNPAVVLRDDSKFPNLKKDFQRAFNPLPDPIIPKVTVIEDDQQAARFIHSLRGSVHRYACDIESRGGLTHTATLISIQFSTDGTSATVIGERCGAFERGSRTLRELRALAASPIEAIWHGGKFDCKILRHTYGIEARVDHDTMLLSYALDERSGTDERIGIHGLDYLLMDTFGWPHYSSEAIERAKKTGVVEDYDEFYNYAGLDVGGTYQLFEHQYPIAQRDEVLVPYSHVLLRANEFLIGVELNGMHWDADGAMDIHEFEVGPELDELKGELLRSHDSPVFTNPASVKQMAHVYYDDWGVQHVMQKRRPTETMQHPERSIDESARNEILAGRFRFRGDTVQQRTGSTIKIIPHPLAEERKQFIINFTETYDRYQKLSKQDGTYLVGLTKRAELSDDLRIHTSLNLHGTNSGRLSSSRPNLQNITRSKEGLPDIRRLFKARDGWKIVQADYSQAELRVIAQESGDRELRRIYNDDLSLHRETATRFFGEDYTTEQYSTCKNVNFGVFYGQSVETFQEKHGIRPELARPYIEWVWKTFTGVKEWEDGIAKTVKTKGCVVSPFGRKRRFHLLTRDNLEACFREGVNFVPQSTASDLTLCAGITVGDETDGSRARIGILVHDSIVAEVRDDYVDEYSAIVEQVMADTPRTELGWTLPFKAEIGVGQTWGDAK